MSIKTQSDKSKAKRARSWQKNKEAKDERKADQAARESHNREVGSTGKQRRYNPTMTPRFGTDRLYQRQHAI